MNLQELKTDLEKQYQIGCYVFLEDLEHGPSSTLYNTLMPLHQEKFENNYRFIFFNFSPVETTTLDHVIATIDYIDISRFFVTVITDQDSTVDYFDSLPLPVRTQKVSSTVQRETVQSNIKPLFNTNNSMCAHAWVGLHVIPSGAIKPCCSYSGFACDESGRAYDIKTDSIGTVLNSKYFDNLRQQFRSGQTPSGCKECVVKEKNGGESRRTLTPYKLKNIYGTIDWESNGCGDRPKFFGVHAGNLCNLKCRICGPEFSSSIAVEQLQNSPNKNILKIIKNNNWVKNNKDFWQLLKNSLPEACSFEILGGEPLLIKENLEFMQYLLDAGQSRNIVFEFTTNGTQFSDVFNHADKFYRIQVNVSIDNIGSRFEVERHGAKWTDIETNLKKFVAAKNQSQTFKLGVEISVNIQNVLYLPELVAWLKHTGVDHYDYGFVTDPEYLSLNSLTPLAKQMVLNKLESTDLPDNDREKLQQVISRVKQSKTSNGQAFCEYTKQKDKIRGENFSNSHKEIAQAMGYVLQ